MNKFQDNAIKCAMALFAVAAMSACSSSEEVPDDPKVNPTYDGNSVKTQFAINVSKAGKSTRMSAEATQAEGSGSYLGMENVRLFTFTDVPTAASKVGSYIELANPSSVTSTQSSHIYKNVDIPVGTKHFLFYSTRQNISKENSGKFGTGSIKSKLFETGSSFSGLNDESFKFSGEKVLTDENKAQINSVRTAFENYLNGIDGALTTTIEGLANSSSQVKTQLTSFQNSFRGKWSNNQKQRAGSADAILRQVQNLYTNVNAMDDLTDKNTINNAIIKSVTDESNAALFTVVQSDKTLHYTDDSNNAYKTFPTAQNLPEGTQVLSYTPGAGFKYVTENPVIGGENNISTQNIIYPLPIVYFDNTPAKATDSDIPSWATTASDWNSDTQWTGWGGEVLETTQSIALKNNINYGVAVLKTTVKCNGSTLEDNRKAYYAEENDQTINIPEGGYPITGILVGGQPQSVGWEMVDATENEKSYVVYDKETNEAKASNNASDPIYTLVFDNWNSKGTQESVNVVIELKNESDAFYGQDGIVEKGQKFYLIGKLDPSSDANIDKFTWPTYSDTYPSATAGSLPKSYTGCYPVKHGTYRVFIQDYTTTANFTIKNLKNAYVTIPDLRATKLQIGISVDLQWEAGLTFNVDL